MNKNPAVALLLAWLLPGAGHWYIGQRVKAPIFCLLIVSVFLSGVWITGGACVNAKPAGMLESAWCFVIRDMDTLSRVDAGRHPFAFLLQGLMGVPGGVACVLSRDVAEPPASKLSDFGMLLTLVGGALNVLIMSDALYRARPPRESA